MSLQFPKIINSQIVRNFISLSSAQLVSKIISLITFAYLARVLSPDGFGVIGFATAFVSYFTLVVNFGFETYGAGEIAKNEHSHKKYVNSIITSRVIISVPAFLFLFISALLLNSDHTIQAAIIISGLNLFAAAISVDWFFHGIQRMGYIAIRQIATSFFSFVAVWILVKSESDVLIAIAVTSISLLINSTWLLSIYSNSFGKFTFEFDKQFIKKIFAESTPIGISSLMIAIYYNLDLIMLGYMKSSEEVGYYSAAYKIIMLFIIFQGLINRSIFPYFAKIATQKNQLRMLVQDYMWMMNRLSIIVCFFILMFSGQIITLIFGHAYFQSIKILQLLGLVVFFIFNETITAPLLLVLDSKKHLIAVGLGALVNVILNILLIPMYGTIGAALSTIGAEILVFSFLFLYSFNALKLRQMSFMYLMILPFGWILTIWYHDGVLVWFTIVSFIIVLIVSYPKLKILYYRQLKSESIATYL